MFNFITNISGCLASASSMVWGNINIIYYSHIPTIIILLLIGVFVLVKGKNISAKFLFILNLGLALWVFADLIAWVSSSSINIMFFWAIEGILEGVFLLASFYFIFTYIYKKYPNLWISVIPFLMFLPIILMTPTNYNLSGFDYNQCMAIDNYFLNYILIFEIAIPVLVFITALIGFFKTPKEQRKSVTVLSIGVLSFLLLYFLSGYLVNQTGHYEFQIYGFISMIILSAFLAYSIVKFKIFDIKLMGAQALVWASVILIGSQFFYLRDSALSVKILTAITLIISSILGLVLVRSVKKEAALVDKLGVANAGQKNLIHIMNHQIKGYLGIDKNIFAELLTDDYGKVPAEAKDIITKGLENSDKGQKYVTDILRGASAETGELVFDMNSVDFKEIVLSAVNNRKEKIENKKLALNVDIPNGNYNMLGDKVQLEEAVRNLIENSICYTVAGSISIHLKRNGGKIVLSIKDTGVGIKSEDRNKLFRAGGVGNDSRKVNANSSGYGLAFVKGVIEKHKGKVWFESAGAGKGSTFFVELPIK